MKPAHIYIFIISAITLLLAGSCKQEPPRQLGVFQPARHTSSLDLEDIQQGGELIVATLYGAQSYFEYYGEGFGTQYRLADEYAKSIGCAIRVDVMRSEAELLQQLQAGDADIVAFALPVSDSISTQFTPCGQAELTHFIDSLQPTAHDKQPVAWLVSKNSPRLAESVNQWMAANSKQFEQITTTHLTGNNGHTYKPRRRNYSPMLNMAKGQISHFDHLFRKYSMHCNWDWRLLAAQAYQESSFDPNAVSYMGALGLMQLMPATARSVGVNLAQVFDPETNLRGAVKYISQLDSHFADITNRNERIKFVLAAYNAGPGHIDDARQLARTNGRDPDRWDSNVDYFVLHLSEPRYFNDPAVAHGYMRGNETYGYVSNIMKRWEGYLRVK